MSDMVRYVAEVDVHHPDQTMQWTLRQVADDLPGAFLAETARGVRLVIPMESSKGAKSVADTITNILGDYGLVSGDGYMTVFAQSMFDTMWSTYDSVMSS